MSDKLFMMIVDDYGYNEGNPLTWPKDFDDLAECFHAFERPQFHLKRGKIYNELNEIVAIGLMEWEWRYNNNGNNI